MKLYVLISGDNDFYEYRDIAGVADSLEKAEEMKREYNESYKDKEIYWRHIEEIKEVELNELTKGRQDR